MPENPAMFDAEEKGTPIYLLRRKRTVHLTQSPMPIDDLQRLVGPGFGHVLVANDTGKALAAINDKLGIEWYGGPG
jgi:hypothetical protein